MDEPGALQSLLARYKGVLKRGADAAPAAAESPESPPIVNAAPPAPKETPPPAPFKDVEINDDFREAMDLIASGATPIFVTGKAGTGKSTFIHYLRSRLDGSLAVVAPTGAAALNARGQTIHSFFHFPARPIDADMIRPLRNPGLYKKISILIIDEASMVRADLLDGVDMFLRRNGRDPERPFGGVQIILVGDLYQLPPVVSMGELELFQRRYRTEFFFDARCLELEPLRVVEFGKVYRQADDRFLRILNAVREGDESDVESALAQLNAASVAPRPKPGLSSETGKAGVVTLACTNADADRVNEAEMRALPGEEKIYEACFEGDFPSIDARLPAPASLRLKEGAQVMFTKNDTDRRWVNGSVGIVKELRGDGVVVELDLGQGETSAVEVESASWESVRHAYDQARDKIVTQPVGVFVQFPLMPAWAVTIHKAQGKTLERVHLDLGRGAFAPGQLYVALSRCRTLEGLTLERPIRFSDVISDDRIKRFHAASSIGRRGGMY